MQVAGVRAALPLRPMARATRPLAARAVQLGVQRTALAPMPLVSPLPARSGSPDAHSRQGLPNVASWARKRAFAKSPNSSPPQSLRKLWSRRPGSPSAARPPQLAKPAGVQGLPQLPARAERVQAAAAAGAGDAKPVLAAAEEKKFLGVAMFTWQKIIPLGLMFFWCAAVAGPTAGRAASYAVPPAARRRDRWSPRLHLTPHLTTPAPPPRLALPQHPVQLHHSA